MNSKFLIAGAAAVALIAGTASAQMAPATSSAPMSSDSSAPAGKTMHHHHMMHHKDMHHGDSMAMGKYAPPAQPIPYAEMAKYTEEDHHMTGGHMHGMHKHAMHKKMDATPAAKTS